MKNMSNGKKFLVAALVLVGFALISALSDTSSPSTQSASVYQGESQVYQPVVQPTVTQPTPAPEKSVQTLQPAIQQTDAQPSLSNSSYYVNSTGNKVHSPAYTSDDSVPAGASARCRDGSYSFSQHRSGTCSRHGGVSEWL
jgi:hypothetical protein